MKITSELLITLLQTPKIGKVSAKYITDNIHADIIEIKELLELIKQLKNQNNRLHVPRLDDLSIANERANIILENCASNGMSVISIFNNEYSSLLKHIADAPLVLYAKGDHSLLNQQPVVAVIGTRQPSDIGVRLGARLTQLLVENNFIIVSGLALGCDSVAHQTCMSHKGKTIAVMASGLDTIYPKQNIFLANEILDSGGLWISEYPVGEKPRNNYFVERDRIQSGISNAICVIETDVKGGTMHTVGFAEKQSRVVSCINHPEQFRSHSQVNGNQMLISTKRAMPLGSAAEIDFFIDKIKDSIIIQHANANNSDSQPNLNI